MRSLALAPNTRAGTAGLAQVLESALANPLQDAQPSVQPSSSHGYLGKKAFLHMHPNTTVIQISSELAGFINAISLSKAKENVFSHFSLPSEHSEYKFEYQRNKFLWVFSPFYYCTRKSSNGC